MLESSMAHERSILKIRRKAVNEGTTKNSFCCESNAEVNEQREGAGIERELSLVFCCWGDFISIFNATLTDGHAIEIK